MSYISPESFVKKKSVCYSVWRFTHNWSDLSPRCLSSPLLFLSFSHKLYFSDQRAHKKIRSQSPNISLYIYIINLNFELSWLLINLCIVIQICRIEMLQSYSKYRIVKDLIITLAQRMDESSFRLLPLHFYLIKQANPRKQHIW